MANSQDTNQPVAWQFVSTEMLKFLNGESPLDGVWFGEDHPIEKGAYWWRKRLNTTPQQRKPLTDEQIVAGGKALAKLHADTCGLDFDDVWKYYAEDHKADAKAAIEAAHGIIQNYPEKDKT